MSAYLMKLTATGAAKVAAEQAGGPVVGLTHIALGDGNGNPVGLPSGTETALLR
jgi:phage-related tail fiber protein